ncbi:hypothetical protein OIU84_015752 [Salix udensis]|uniref:Allene oxide synthase n=1 Tax=Salix udensis TaxID=889485 RepID=A0AAD6NPL8_9ROSI|nr:hypothetical protein OIU84_015752 [Salix udensis]
MASSSLAFPILQPQFRSPKNRSSSKPSTRSLSFRTIRSSVSEKPSVSVPGVTVSPPENTKLPIRKDPRSNMGPGPFIAPNPQVVVLLDGKSFPVLFDVTKVEKKDLFTGTYMPSTELTGGYRTLSYLDPSEPMHAKLKQFMFYLLKSRRDHVIPEFKASYTELFTSLEKDLALKGKANFVAANDQAAFNFLAQAWFGTEPAQTSLGLDGPGLVSKWVLFNLGPVLSLGLPKYLEDLTIHSFRLPPSLIKKNYQRLYDFFYASSSSLLDEAENLGNFTRGGMPQSSFLHMLQLIWRDEDFVSKHDEVARPCGGQTPRSISRGDQISCSIQRWECYNEGHGTNAVDEISSLRSTPN